MSCVARATARRGVERVARAALTFLALTLTAVAWAWPPPPVVPARARRTIGIVLAGPASARAAMHAAIDTALGAEAGVSWSERDTLPNGEPGSLAATTSGANPTGQSWQSWQIWIDVTDPVRVRILLPGGVAAVSGAGAAVRTVDTPAPGADGWKPVARETVAQIVRSAVQILSAVEIEDALPVASAPAPEEEVPPESYDADLSARRGPAGPLVPDATSSAPRGRFGVAVGVGAHTSPFLLAEPHTESHWLGISLELAARWETAKALLALRASWEPSERSIDAIDLKSQLCSIGLAVSRRLTFGEFTLSLGGEVGGLLLRQEISAIPDPYNTGTSTYPAALTLPGQLGTTWSSGFLFGPVAELRLAVSPHAFIHIGGARPIALMNVADINGSEAWHASGYWRLVGGLGASL